MASLEEGRAPVKSAPRRHLSKQEEVEIYDEEVVTTTPGGVTIRVHSEEERPLNGITGTSPPHETPPPPRLISTTGEEGGTLLRNNRSNSAENSVLQPDNNEDGSQLQVKHNGGTVHGKPQRSASAGDDSVVRAEVTTIRSASTTSLTVKRAHHPHHLKVLVRSQALRCDDANDAVELLAPQTKSARHRLTKQGTGSSSQGSQDGGSSSCLSRDSSTEASCYTDATGVDLERFIVDTLHKNQKDRQMMLDIEAQLVHFINDLTRPTHKFQPMTSYHRMMVHRVAAFFGLEHNVDQGCTAVIVQKTRAMRIPEMRFKEYISGPCADDCTPGGSVSPPLGGTHVNGDGGAASPVEPSHEPPRRLNILKRESNSQEEQPSLASSSGVHSPERQLSGEQRRSKSIEEREEEYHKARARIFNTSRSGSKSGSIEFTSEDGLLRPPYQAGETPEGGGGVQYLLLTKNEAGVSLSVPQPSRGSVTKASSFGGITREGSFAEAKSSLAKMAKAESFNAPTLGAGSSRSAKGTPPLVEASSPPQSTTTVVALTPPNRTVQHCSVPLMPTPTPPQRPTSLIATPPPTAHLANVIPSPGISLIAASPASGAATWHPSADGTHLTLSAAPYVNAMPPAFQVVDASGGPYLLNWGAAAAPRANHGAAATAPPYPSQVLYVSYPFGAPPQQPTVAPPAQTAPHPATLTIVPDGTAQILLETPTSLAQAVVQPGEMSGGSEFTLAPLSIQSADGTGSPISHPQRPAAHQPSYVLATTRVPDKSYSPVPGQQTAITYVGPATIKPHGTTQGTTMYYMQAPPGGVSHNAGAPRYVTPAAVQFDTTQYVLGAAPPTHYTTVEPSQATTLYHQQYVPQAGPSGTPLLLTATPSTMVAPGSANMSAPPNGTTGQQPLGVHHQPQMIILSNAPPGTATFAPFQQPPNAASRGHATPTYTTFYNPPGTTSLVPIVTTTNPPPQGAVSMMQSAQPAYSPLFGASIPQQITSTGGTIQYHAAPVPAPAPGPVPQHITTYTPVSTPSTSYNTPSNKNNFQGRNLHSGRNSGSGDGSGSSHQGVYSQPGQHHAPSGGVAAPHFPGGSGHSYGGGPRGFQRGPRLGGPPPPQHQRAPLLVSQQHSTTPNQPIAPSFHHHHFTDVHLLGGLPLQQQHQPQQQQHQAPPPQQQQQGVFPPPYANSSLHRPPYPPYGGPPTLSSSHAFHRFNHAPSGPPSYGLLGPNNGPPPGGHFVPPVASGPGDRKHARGSPSQGYHRGGAVSSHKGRSNANDSVASTAE